MAQDALVETVIDLMRIIRRLTHPVRRGEMTPEQYGLLRRLAREGPLRVGDVAAQLGISQSAATMACQRLERAGWVTRVRRPEDERVVEVALTPAGHARVGAWLAARRATIGRLLDSLDAQEQAQLYTLLRRVVERAEVTLRDPDD
ncbi:MAG: MarR family transcriptional regulator [Actinomycetia bacterium]|nr:MarR family transcriptional regulator [Actinomycetes bacterium]